MTDNIAWVEIAELDNERLEFGGLEKEGLQISAVPHIRTVR